MLFTHLAKSFKGRYQVDPLLKYECKTCSQEALLSSVSKVLLAYGSPEAVETARFFSLMDRFFDITGIRNTLSLEFEQKPMLTPFRSVSDKRFS